MGVALSNHAVLDEGYEIISTEYDTPNVYQCSPQNMQFGEMCLPETIKQRQRMRHEIATIKKWQNILSNEPNNNSLRGMFWYQAIGNDLNISWNAYNYYKIQKQPGNINDNINNNGIQSIFKHENKDTICEGLKRRNSIQRDVQRMHLYKNKDKNRKQLQIECVLMAYCNYNKNISYTQFMTNLVEILLNYQNEKMCFISLCNILNYELKVQQRINIFNKILYFNSSIQNKNNLFDGYVMDCIQTLFCRQLSIDIVCKILDLYFLFGEIIIWKCAVLLLIEIDQKLFVNNKRDINYILNALQSIDKLLIDIDPKCFINKINSIKLPNDVNQLFIN